MFSSPVELVKLQLHSRLRVQYGPNRDWSFAERTITAPITPMKSERWDPNWSFANSQGSWFKGGGSRNGSGGG